MPTIQDLYDVSKTVDTDSAPFEELTYDISNNDILGLPSDSQSPSLTIAPFGKFLPNAQAFAEAANNSAPGKMPIQQAFKAVLQEGYKLVSEGPHQDTIIIDIADLDDENKDLSDVSFFTEGDKDSIARALADLVNSIPVDVKPVVRFLRGSAVKEFNLAHFWNDTRRPSIEALFLGEV